MSGASSRKSSSTLSWRTQNEKDGSGTRPMGAEEAEEAKAAGSQISFERMSGGASGGASAEPEPVTVVAGVAVTATRSVVAVSKD